MQVAPANSLSLTEILAWHLVVVLVGVAGIVVALPRTPPVPIGKPVVVHALEPFGRHVGVGITVAVLVVMTAFGDWRLYRSGRRWTVATLTLLAVGVAWLFLALSIIGAGDVFI